MTEEKNPEPISPRRLMEIKVKEVMNKSPGTVSADTPIDVLLEKISEQIDDCFPVVDNDNKLIGIVTESDLFQVLRPPALGVTIGRASIREILKYSANTVGGIMTKRPVSLAPDMTIVEAMNIMASHKLRHLPVVEGEKLVGLVCLRNILELYRILR
ncbi:MAG: CBS domain-containing protein [Methanobacteriota archaeon]